MYLNYTQDVYSKVVTFNKRLIMLLMKNWILLLLLPCFAFLEVDFDYKRLSNRKLKKEFFDSSFYQHEGYLLGDIHGLANSYDLLFKTIKHLHLTKGVRDVFMERGRDYLYFVNRYLSGELSSFDLQFHLSIKNTQLQTQNEFDFFDRVKKYNTKLPDSLKVILRPLFEHSTPNTYLNYMHRTIHWKEREHLYLNDKINAFQALTNMESSQYLEELDNFNTAQNGFGKLPSEFFYNDSIKSKRILTVNPSFNKEYRGLYSYCKRMLSKKDYMIFREREMANEVSNHIRNRKTPFLLFTGMDHVLKIQSKKFNVVDSLFWELTTRDLGLKSDYFCFITPIMYKCDLLTSNRDLYDAETKTLKWVKKDRSMGTSLRYLYFKISRSDRTKRKYSWFKGNSDAFEQAMEFINKGHTVKEVTDYIILIKKGKACKPLYDEVIRD